MDILTLLTGGAFVALFAVSTRRYLQHRGPIELGVVLVFTGTAAIFALSAVSRIAPGLADSMAPASTVLLIAQPVLIVRLVALIVPLPRWVVPAAAAGFLVSVIAFYGTERSVPAILLVVGYFAITEVLAAVLLVTESRRRVGLPRVRLATAGFATALFGIAVLVAGLGSAASGGGGSNVPEVMVISRLAALAAGLGYLAAFVPPAWLRQLGHRSVAFDLVRSIVSSRTGTDPRVHWSELAGAASSILGTRDVTIIGPNGPLADESSARQGEQAAHRRGDPVVIEVPLLTEGRHIATARIGLQGRPLFVEDDIALIELLGSLTARAVERKQAFATLAATARAIEDSVAIRASEARFRALVDAAPNAILSVDASGVVNWCTRSAAAAFGAAESELIGRRLESLVAPVEGLLAAVTEGSVHRFETTATRPDGSTFPAEVAVSAFELESEAFQLVIVADVTWRHEATAARDRFIGVLSHELRTPITSIFGGTQVLLSRGDRVSEEARRELLADIAAEAERLQRMIENLLVLARVERGADVVDVSPILLHRVLPEVIRREQALMPAATIRLDVPPTLPMVASDESSLALVLRNLVSNAAKYGGRNVTIDVSATAQPDGQVAIRVQDDGPGFDASESDRLFELYFRTRESAAAPGSGIGLFVCRQLVGALGGRIWARPRPGRGAEFGFTLPPYEDVEEWAVEEQPADSLASTLIPGVGTLARELRNGASHDVAPLSAERTATSG